MIIKIKEGGILPAWYYGHYYDDYTSTISVFAIIPLNYILKIFRYLENKWNLIRKKRYSNWILSIIDNEKTEKSIFLEKVWDGLRDGSIELIFKEKHGH